MSCEKQFLPANNTFLYCSERHVPPHSFHPPHRPSSSLIYPHIAILTPIFSCRIHDQAPTPISATRTHSYPSYTPTSPPLTPYTRAFSSYSNPSHEDGPDIIPRFSPTQSRPRSYFNSDPYPQTYQEPSHFSGSLPHDHNSQSSTALASLRELATALPKANGRPESPPKSRASSINRPSSGVWNYIPFTSSKTSTPTPNGTPGNSYTSPSQNPYTASPSYSAYSNNGYARSKEDLYAYGKSQGGTYQGMDRPLPPRSGPGGYGHRPRSIDLVTPFPAN